VTEDYRDSSRIHRDKAAFDTQLTTHSHTALHSVLPKINMAEEEEGNKSPPQEAQGVDENKNDVIGSAALRPIFLGNLNVGCKHEDIIAIFERPIVPPDADADSFRSMPVDRIDYKRGYCFVFLKDATTEDFKEMAQRFVNDINGM